MPKYQMNKRWILNYPYVVERLRTCSEQITYK